MAVAERNDPQAFGLLLPVAVICGVGLASDSEYFTAAFGWPLEHLEIERRRQTEDQRRGILGPSEAHEADVEHEEQCVSSDNEILFSPQPQLRLHWQGYYDQLDEGEG